MIPALTNAVAAMAPAAIKTTKAVHSAQRRLCAAIVNLFAAMFYAKPETHCGRPCGVHGFGPRLTSSSAPGRFVCGEAWDAVDLACCMFEGLVDRDARSPATLDEYRPLVNRVVTPGVGSLRLGEVSAPRLDRFVQAVLANKGYATAKQSRTVLSGIFRWLVRRGALSVNPVRDLTPLELDRDRTARALSVEEMRAWLALLTQAISRDVTTFQSSPISCPPQGFASARRWV
jgi:hypothetical protein